MSNDISFCDNVKCERKDCRRHWENIKGDGLYSMATFNESTDTSTCDWYWER